MKTATRTIGDVLVVKITGAVDSKSAGALYDALVDCAAGRTKMIVDIAGVTLLTHAGVRGLIVAARLMKSAKGELRICGAAAPIAAIIQGLGFNFLLKCDADLKSAIAAIGGRGDIEEARARLAYRLPSAA